MYLDKNELTVLVFFVTEHKLLVQSEEYSDGEVYIYIYIQLFCFLTVLLLFLRAFRKKSL